MQYRSLLKTHINKAGDKNNLPVGWLNDDFIMTKSYSSKIREVSEFYKSFLDCLEVRTIKDEFLIAMKPCWGRKYKSDYSDILGILLERKEEGKEITFSLIDKAIKTLYGSWEKISMNSKEFLTSAFKSTSIDKSYVLKAKKKENMLMEEIVNRKRHTKEPITEKISNL